MKQKIGFVGVGLMGGGMAKNLLAAGYDVLALDVDKAKLDEVVKAGGTAVSAPEKLAQEVDIIILSLPSSQIVNDVVRNTLKLMESGRKGLILVAKPSATEDQLMDVAVGAGADDYSDAGEDWQITCDPSALEGVSKALEAAKIAAKSSNLAFVPKNKKEVSGRDAELCLNLAEALDDHDDAQNVFADFDVSDEEMARIAGA